MASPIPTARTGVLLGAQFTLSVQPTSCEDDAINTLARTPTLSPTLAQPRARGAVALSVKATDAGTGIRNLRQSGSFRAVFPRSKTTGIEAVLVNTAGGVTGGDIFDTKITCETQTNLTITTQAAERAYRAQLDETGRVSNRIDLRGSARLNWLPQETILFNNCAFERALRVEMDADASLLLVEPLVFGRTAMAETLTQCRFKDRIEITRAGTPLFLDSISIQGNAAAHLSRLGTADGANAIASIIFATPEAERYLNQILPLLSATSGASMIRDHLLYIRVLATDSFELRQTLIPILKCLGDTSLPRSWML